MPGRQNVTFLDTQVHSIIGLSFVAAFALLMGLAVWHAAVGNNPIADFIAQSNATQALLH